MGYGGAQPIYGAACRVCGNSLVAGMTQCSRCGAPVGMIVNANDPTANSYLPVGMPAASSAPMAPYSAAMLQAAPNNSGQGGPVPVEVPTGWNWGAAFATYFWAAAHQVWWYVAMQSVLILVILTLWIGAMATSDAMLSGITGLLLILYCAIWTICRVSFGLHGNRMAWRKRRFDNLYQFVDVQEAWKPIGILMALVVLLCVLLLGGLILLYLLGASMMR